MTRTSNDALIVSVLNSLGKGYSVVNIQCKDQTKLLFDVISTIGDMQYVAFHARVNTIVDSEYLVYIPLPFFLILIVLYECTFAQIYHNLVSRTLH